MPFDAFNDSDTELRSENPRKALPMSEYLRRRFPVGESVLSERERGYREYLKRIKK